MIVAPHDDDTPNRRDCMNCGYCSDCIQRSIDAAEDCNDCGTCDKCKANALTSWHDDDEDKTECSSCEGTGYLDDEEPRMICPWCVGTGRDRP